VLAEQPGGAFWRHSGRAGARAASFLGAGVLACAGGVLAAPAPQALLVFEFRRLCRKMDPPPGLLTPAAARGGIAALQTLGVV
jgi:hypothetical protein